MRDDDLLVENSSNSLSPFEWKGFKHIKRDYNLYRQEDIDNAIIEL